MQWDVILVHAPSVHDFRQRDDILFAYLSNSDSVHVSAIFEMPPVGILGIQQHLQRCGLSCEFFNVASQMLRYPDFDVVEFFERTPARYIGVDLNWLAHAHGALELTRLYKEIHPEARTMVGGIASTYYHEELIEYPQIDYVVRGYDTLLPIQLLLEADNDFDRLATVPNLTWKHSGETHVNAMTHVPSTYTAAVDWARVFSPDRTGLTPYNIVIPQAGCEYSCNWCGGSRYSYKKYMNLKTPVHKPPHDLRRELESIAASSRAHTVTMIDFWHEYPELFDLAMDTFTDPTIDAVHFSLHRLPAVAKGRKMAAPAKAVLELSPDSHDHEIAKASGRGFYTMDEMEHFIDALIDDVYSFEIYYMLGLPGQTEASIWDTIDYCEHLLKKYRGRRVIPFVCPMLPFLDPGSAIFDNPDKWGYTIFHRTLEDHRKALLCSDWADRLNYETRWLSRDELVNVSYASVRALTELKGRYGKLPRGLAEGITSLIDATVSLLDEVRSQKEALRQGIDDPKTRELRRRIKEYNTAQFARVRSQQRPSDLGFTRQQWFDTDEAFERVLRETRVDITTRSVAPSM